MKTTKLLVLGLAALATALATTGNLRAQDRPQNFDPEQMRQRMMERLREQFAPKDDAEWKIISDRLTKVMDARRALGGPGGFGPPPGGPGGLRPPRDGNPDGAGQARPSRDGDQNGPDRFRAPAGPGGFNREPDPDAEALRKAIEAKASPEEIKAKLAKVREARKEKEAKLEKAQEDLRQVLSLRQEATAVTMGLLK
jgi:hypothetical protein